MEIIHMIMSALIMFGIYFLPSIAGLKKRNAVAIFVLNGLLGWTLIGWVVAMIWALTYEEPTSKKTNYINNEPQ